MAIFDKSEKAELIDSASGTSSIAQSTSVVGKIDTECELHIAGEFEGEIHSKSVVKVAQSGVLKCTQLKAEKMIVEGRFFGTADCDQIALISGGEAEGKLISSGLTIDAKSSFQGESVRRKQGDTTKLLEFSSEPSSKPSNTTDKDKRTSTKNTP